ncbi:ggt, partial [Symbiodinium necroappetens]
SYHGASASSLGATGDFRRKFAESGQNGFVKFFNPQPNGFSWGTTDYSATQRTLACLEDQILAEGPETIAAVLVESIVGAGGVLVPPEGYMEGLRALCDKYDILLICDEVMVGFGRTGHFFGFQHFEGVVPDIVTSAKGLTASFMPLSMVGVRQKIKDYFMTHPVGWGSTFHAHPVALACAYETVKYVLKENVLDNVRNLEPVMLEELQKLTLKHASVRQARAVGLFGCLDLQTPIGQTVQRLGEPSPPAVQHLRKAMFDNGLFSLFRPPLLHCSPPLIINEDYFLADARTPATDLKQHPSKLSKSLSEMWRLLVLVAAAAAADQFEQRSVVGQHGMVSTSHPEASAAATHILERGGNAVDAALAVHFVLAVVEPQHVSIGGGGVMLYKPLDGKALHVDFREEAPALYHPKTFCKNATCVLDPHCDCNGTWPSTERCTGGHATGTPGFPALLSLAVRDQLASLPLSEIAGPAIDLARNGWIMDEGLHKSIQQHAPQLARDPASRELFLNASGSGPKAEVGEILRNPDLADTLELIVTAPEDFYTGHLGAEFVQAAAQGLNSVTGKHGLLSMADLHGYRAVYREPVQYEYTTASGTTYNITGSAPPFSGGVAQAQIFNYLEQVEGTDATAARRLGLFMDAQNAAFADRNQYVADPDFVDVDVKTLTSKSYAASRAQDLVGGSQRIRGNEMRALSVPVSPGILKSSRGSSSSEDHGTSHMTIIDSQGNIVAMTTTVNMIMGSRVTVPGRGYLLNNEMCDFDPLGLDSAGQMTVNAAEGGKRPRRTALGDDSSSLGGKRPRSSMSPTLVVPKEPGKAAFSLLGLGAPGGSDIIGGVANVLRHTLTAPGAEVRQLQAHTNAPRAIGKNEPRMGNAVVELALYEDKETVAALQSWGYNLTHTPYAPPYYVGETYSRVQSAMMWRADS